MKRLFLVMFSIFLLASPCLAYSVPDDTVVYVTDTGTKYHREDCSYLHSSHQMTIQQAEAAGYGPCSRCRPDRNTGEYESNWAGDSGSSANNQETKPTVRPTPDQEQTAEPKPSLEPSNETSDFGFWGTIALIIFFLLFGVPFVLGIAMPVIWVLYIPIKSVISKIKDRKHKKGEQIKKWDGPALYELIKEEDDHKKDYWVVTEKGKRICADNPEELGKKIDAEAKNNF